MSEMVVEKPCACCPTCLLPVVYTFAFNGWEVFCPNCRQGAGEFDGWAVERTMPVSLVDAAELKFRGSLDMKLYNDHPRLNSQYKIQEPTNED